MGDIKHLAVFCGASSGNKSEYTEAAKKLGEAFISQGIGLVYGGGTVGLMGVIARTVCEGLGPQGVYGVLPRELAPREVSGELIGELVLVDDMHTRKALMAKRADGFIGLPGGFGTLEELAEVITWQQLGFHAKPIGLLNIEGFYDPLLQFFSQAVQSGFIQAHHYNSIIVDTDPQSLIRKMREFKAPLSLIDGKRMAEAGKHAVGMDVSGLQDGQDNNNTSSNTAQP